MYGPDMDTAQDPAYEVVFLPPWADIDQVALPWRVCYVNVSGQVGAIEPYDAGHFWGWANLREWNDTNSRPCPDADDYMLLSTLPSLRATALNIHPTGLARTPRGAVSVDTIDAGDVDLLIATMGTGARMWRWALSLIHI